MKRFDYEMSLANEEGSRKIFLGCGFDLESGSDWESQMRQASECGFTYWEFALGAEDQASRGWAAESDSEKLKTLSEELSVRPVGARLDLDWELKEDSRHEECLDKLVSLVQTAIQMGAKRISIQPPAVSFEEMTEEMWRRFLTGWERLVAVAEAGKARALLPTCGIKERVEGEEDVWNYHPTFIIHPDGLERVIHSLEDVLWLEYSPGEIKPFWPQEKMFWSDLLQPWVDSCRLSERKWVSMDHRHWRSVALGDDFLEYGPILRALRVSGMCWIQPVSAPDWEEGMFRSIEYVKNLEENFLEFYFVRK